MPLARDPADGRTDPSREPIRVMIVDDSAVIRRIMSNWLTESPDLQVVATHHNGRLAVEDVVRSRPEVVILDIEMPEMDGLTALPLILRRKPGTVVLVASTLSRRGAEVSLKALDLGAADYLPKPDGAGAVLAAADFKADLVAKVRQLGLRARRWQAPRPAAASPGVRHDAARGPAPARLQAYSAAPVRAVVVGSSTGGPQALTRFFTDLGGGLNDVPVFVAQHMPPTFTTILAEHLAVAAARPAHEGIDGEAVRPGHIYLAPGGKHMLVAKDKERPTICLSDEPPVNFCKPAVDPLFQSVAAVYRSGTLALVLTGMGSDGARGARVVADAGGSVIAQDEASSVVWGMPGAAVAAGACCDVLPIGEIGAKVARILKKGCP